MGQDSVTEARDLRYTLETEKLAHDVYEVFLANWNTFPFLDAMDEKAIHMEALKAMLTRVEISEEVSGENGVFALPVFKEWFDKHIADGMKSPAGAYRTGALIEEIAIRDLEMLAACTDDSELRYTYQWLIKSSRSHLYVFVCHLKRLNIEYLPLILPYEEFERIMKEEAWQEPGNARA